jgi:hypothetical protein
MIRLRKNIKILIKYIIAPVLGLWLFYSLYRQIQDQPDLHHSLQLIKSAPYGKDAFQFWAVVLLAFVNWGFESRKWQILLKPIQDVSFFTAYRAVLSGVTFSLNTPNRMGEYGGRMLYVSEGNKLRSISLSIAGSISQLIITMLMGCIALGWFIYHANPSAEPFMGLSLFWIKTLFTLSISTTLIIILFFFRLSWLTSLIEKLPASQKFVYYINVLDEFHPKLLLRLLLLSFFRYIVFVIQYIFLLQVLHVDIPYTISFYLTSILFLVLAIVPSFAIADLGIRGKFSTELFGFYSVNTAGIIGTTFGIWFINLFIPALLGSLFILSIKIFKD